MKEFNVLQIKVNWLHTTIIFFCSWLICLVSLFLMSNNLQDNSFLEQKNNLLEKKLVLQSKNIDNYKKTIEAFDEVTDTKNQEVDSLKNEILLKETDTKFIHIYDEKIKYINRYSISDMQSNYNDLFSAKE